VAGRKKTKGPSLRVLKRKGFGEYSGEGDRYVTLDFVTFHGRNREEERTTRHWKKGAKKAIRAGRTEWERRVSHVEVLAPEKKATDPRKEIPTWVLP